MSYHQKVRLKKRKLTTVTIYSRLLLTIFLLLAQFAYYIYLCLRLSSHTSYLVAASIALSAVFIIYLINSSKKPDFKLAWTLPVLFMPLVGISMYFLTRYNHGRRRIRKKIISSKKITNKFISLQENGEAASKALQDYPEISDLVAYTRSIEHFPAFSGNRTRYYSSGEEAFPHMLDELRGAKHFIFLDYFIIDICSMWNQILEILAEKASGGVKVRVLFDSIGSVSIASRRFRNALADMGIEVREFMPIIPVFDMGLNNRDHHKIMDIDGRVCFTGGMNLTDEYINRTTPGKKPRFNYWKDSVICVEGCSVDSFTRMFLQIWHTQERHPKGLESDCVAYLNLPHESFNESGAVIAYADDDYNNQDLAENIYTYILSKSRKFVHIMSPYLILDESITGALIFAVQRGLDVRIILPAKYDHYITHCIGLRYAKELLQHGVRIFVYGDGFLHSKVFVGDDIMASVGSVNLDYRSFYYHFECGAFLYKTDSITDIEADFQKTLSRCTELTLDSYKKHIPHLQRSIGWITKIFAPLL